MFRLLDSYIALFDEFLLVDSLLKKYVFRLILFSTGIPTQPIFQTPFICTIGLLRLYVIGKENRDVPCDRGRATHL